MANEPSNWKLNGRTLDSSSAEINFTEFPESFSMAAAPGPYGIPIDAPLAVTMIKALRDIVAKQPEDSVLRRLIEGSFAITLDKNILLKILSQPKCEGVRFYLCVKKGEKGEDVLSLVTVGVDDAGKDLLYEFKEGTAIREIPTRSLVAEYGFPPGLLEQTDANLDPFVLFKFSK